LKIFLRQVRGWLYRHIPGCGTSAHRRRCIGFSRRWGLENHGFTKKGFFVLFQEKFLAGTQPETFWEMAAGDGLVGSLGVWLEGILAWKVEIWEHREIPLAHCRKNRPKAHIHGGRKVDWDMPAGLEAGVSPWGLTARSARDASAVCRAIRKKQIRPQFIALWNPTERVVWATRLGAEGYSMQLVYQRMEIYRLRKK
jgi:hypothetical protein